MAARPSITFTLDDWSPRRHLFSLLPSECMIHFFTAPCVFYYSTLDEEEDFMF